MSEDQNQYEDANISEDVSSASEQNESPDQSVSESKQGVEQSSDVQEQGEESSEQESQESKPFHEHPRFKELIERNNEYKQQITSMQDKLSQFEKDYKKADSKEQEDQLLAQMKQANPEFAERFSKTENALKELEQLRSWKQQVELENAQKRINDTVENLHKENNVKNEYHEIYRLAMVDYAQRNNINDEKKVPEIYKAIHDRYSKLFDNIQREDRKQYAKEKKADNVPSTKRGPVPKTKKSDKPKIMEIPDGLDAKEYLKDQVVRQVMSSIKSEQDI